MSKTSKPSLSVLSRPALLASLFLCLGLSAPACAQQQDPGCAGTSVPLDVSVNLKPFARLKVHGREGNFLIDTGAVANHIDTTSFGFSAGTSVTINSPAPLLPTVHEIKFIVQDLDYQRLFAPLGGYAGAIGTSVLRTRTIAFHYNKPTPFLVIPNQPCSPQYFERLGYVPISQAGFYGPSNPAGIPVIFAQIGPVRAPIWIDSGSGATSKHLNMDINAALFQKLRDAGIRMKQAGSVSVIDCKGRKFGDQLWQVEGAPLAFTTQDGQSLFEYAPPTLEVNGPSQCGLIGSHQEPLGTVGALMLARWGTVIFDGPNERLWVTKNHFPVAAQAAYQSVFIAQGDGGGFTTTTNVSADAAKSNALKSCGESNRNCKVVATLGQNQFACLAVARVAVGKFSITKANAMAAAQRAALSACAAQGGTDCRVVQTTCNG